MPQRKSLGSNPLGTKSRDSALREALQQPPAMSEVRPTTAFVFSGRGAEAAFEVGVLAGLGARGGGISADVVTGVSLGALNAALVASHRGDIESAASELRGVWLDSIAGDSRTGRNGLYRSRGDFRALFEPSRLPRTIADFVSDGSHLLSDAVRHGAHALRSSDDLARRMLWLADLGTVLSLDPLSALVGKSVDLQALGKSHRQLRVSTANWVTGRIEVRDGTALSAASGQDLIVAAAARPGIFPCLEIDGTPQVEATAFSTSDLNAAIEAGASLLHVPVFMASRAQTDRPASTIDAFDRLLAELQLRRLERELAELRARTPRSLTVHLYRGSLGPAKSHGFLDLRREHLLALIEHGRAVAARHDCRESLCVIADLKS